ncbi:MAG: histone H1-like repetitive region-containing protein [Deltaproteobacteria bacterium]|nr:histone H1-like repetitive region-containing protein [Deltaproteobacteria bacterium]
MATKKKVSKKTIVKKKIAKTKVAKSKVVKKTVPKKKVAKKTPAKKAAPKKTVVKKTVLKKTVARKAPAKKAAPKKTVAKKTLVKKRVIPKATPKATASIKIPAKLNTLFNSCRKVKDVLDLKDTKKSKEEIQKASATLLSDIQNALNGLPQAHLKELFTALPWDSKEGEKILRDIIKKFKLAPKDLCHEDSRSVLDDKADALSSRLDVKAALEYGVTKYTEEFALLVSRFRKSLLTAESRIIPQAIESTISALRCTTTCCISVQDETARPFNVSRLQFTGDGVTASKSPDTSDIAVINVPVGVDHIHDDRYYTKTQDDEKLDLLKTEVVNRSALHAQTFTNTFSHVPPLGSPFECEPIGFGSGGGVVIPIVSVSLTNFPGPATPGEPRPQFYYNYEVDGTKVTVHVFEKDGYEVLAEDVGMYAWNGVNIRIDILWTEL